MHEEMKIWMLYEYEKRGLDMVVINGDIIHNDFSYMSEVKNHWEQLAVPIYAVHGNHDVCNEMQWKEIWSSSWQYILDKQDSAFIMLNTADENGKYICSDLHWTKEHLEKYKEKKHMFVFMHITPLK